MYYTENGYGEWKETDSAVALRCSGGTLGGGGETIVICSYRTQLEHCAEMITKAQTGSMSNKESS